VDYEFEIAKMIRKGELQNGVPRCATAFELSCQAYGLDPRKTSPWQLAYKMFGLDPKVTSIKELLSISGYGSIGELIANAL